MDRGVAVRYNDWVVWEKNEQMDAREKFSREATAYLDHLYRVALHLAKDESEAGDLVQETYARALEFHQQYTPGTNMRAWMTRILYNFFFDHCHQKKKWVSVDESNPGEQETIFYDRVAGENPGPEEHVLLSELHTKIMNALKKIPEEFRVPIVLVDMGDFSYAEAAEILSCPLGTIRSRLSRGRRLLSRSLRSYVEVRKKG